MFTPMLCDYDQGSPAIKADMAHQSSAGELGRPLHAMEANFVLVARHPETGGRNREGRMLANVFSNTTPPRVEKTEGVPLLGLALSLCLMAAIAALAFVACAAL